MRVLVYTWSAAAVTAVLMKSLPLSEYDIVSQAGHPTINRTFAIRPGAAGSKAEH
jgi:hypothetical protein